MDVVHTVPSLESGDEDVGDNPSLLVGELMPCPRYLARPYGYGPDAGGMSGTNLGGEHVRGREVSVLGGSADGG